MKFSRKQVIIILGGAVLVILIVVVIFLNLRPKANTAASVKLAVWGIEPKDAFGSLVASYPYGTVSYTQLTPASYQSQILSALAAGTGPDVFEIGNRDLPKWESVLAPFPTSSTAFGLLQLSQLFPDVVTQDFVSNGQIYGLPLTIDTLAMVYNKDLFNSAGIATPPVTWDDFDSDVLKLRKVNAQGQIAQAAAAIGGSEASIPNAPDILSLLMLQNGTQMTNSNDTAATFASQAGGGTGGTGGGAGGGSSGTSGSNAGSQGLAAFNFYLQFANQTSPNYTWNDAMGNGFDSFASGKTAIVFAYASDLAAIRAKAPYLNIGIAPMPQPTGASVAVSYPKYYGFVAAKAGQWADAWNFILYLTALSGDGKTYQATAAAPSALRTDIAGDLADPSLAVFASQALTARSWHEADAAQTDSILNQAIVSVLTSAANSTQALTQAQTAVTALMNQ